MPRIQVKGTTQTAQVDAALVKRLPKSIWADRVRSKIKPMCRHEGKTMTLLRAVGLMAGLSPEKYILPRNGDYFDCRQKNAAEYVDLPADRLPVYKNSKSGVKGVRARSDGSYDVILVVGGRQKYFGTARNLGDAGKILKQARKLV